MSFRRLTASALFLAGLFAVAVAAQPPGGGSPDQPGTGSGTAKKGDGDKKKADPTDATVAAALANDPDVKVARAKVELAEAELAKAKQAVVLKVMTLTATIRELKSAVEAAQVRVALVERAVKTGGANQQQLLDDRVKLEAAQAALARAETELKLLTGGGGKDIAQELADPNASAVAAGLRWLGREHQNPEERAALAQWLLAEAVVERHAIKGPIPDRIRAALDKSVKLGAKGEMITFEKALEVFKKDAGLDVPVRGKFPMRPVIDPKNPPKGGDEIKYQPIEIALEGEELPVGAWFQLFEDNVAYTSGKTTRRFQVYVREYGLLISAAETAPPDAPTLTEFWKQKPPAKKESGGLLDPDTKDPEAMLSYLKYKRSELSNKYGPGHPEMVALNKQIEQLEKELKERGDRPKK